MWTLGGIVSLLCSGGALSAQSLSNQPLRLDQFKLANGLTVILSEDHSKPEVFGLVVTKAGSKHDPTNATGLAHYQEHLLFKGTTQLGTTNWALEKGHLDRIFALYDQLGRTSDAQERARLQAQINEESVAAGQYAIPNEFDKLVKRIGGTGLNANTSWDRTVYFNLFPPNELRPWLDLYSHRFLEPVFRLFQAELEVVYEEKNLANDSFETGLMEFTFRNFFRKHPYGQQTILGTVEHLKNPSLTKMMEFFKTYYVANNMALVLCGDFRAAEVRPLIEAKFGVWRSGTVPVFPEFPEAPFHGRELAKTRMTPIKLEVFGFRAPKAGHPDEIPFQVCNGLLANGSQNGLLDKLTLDHKLLAAQPFPLILNDHGASMILAVPKILFQTLGSAEKLVRAELDKLGRGDFDPALLEAAKNQLYVSYCKQLEGNEPRGTLIAEVFAQNRDLQEVLTFPARVKAVTRDDVLRVARQYYGSNYLCLQSRMGWPAKEKLAKPGYKPILPKTEARSPYAEAFEKIPAAPVAARLLDFKQDVTTLDLPGSNSLSCVFNPHNDIFSLKFKYGWGVWNAPRLNLAAVAMNLAGTTRQPAYELKTAFSRLGCTCQFSADDSYTEIQLEGLEANLGPALALLQELLTTPRLEKDKLGLLVDAERAQRKLEQSEPDQVAGALYEYARRRQRSHFLRRLSLSEVKALKPEALLAEFRQALGWQCEVHYSGRLAPATVRAELLRQLDLSGACRPTASPVSLDNEQYATNTIFFLSDKKAVQSKIHLLVNATPYTLSQEPCIDAYNQYLSGGFSGLLLQEVREYRSLAYNADAAYVVPRRPGVKGYLRGTIFTQADKTLEALDVLTGLLRHMPEKPERLDTIRSFLDLTVQTEYPGFRELSEKVAAWKLRGYTANPLQVKAEVYHRLTFDDLRRFYRDHIQPQPIVLAVVGDPKRIDLKALARFGQVIPVKQKEIFR